MNMIEGINPLTISMIYATKFMRWGRHPSWSKVMNKRHPIRGLFGFYANGMFDGVRFRASVVIEGANGCRLKTIECTSNNSAIQLSAVLNEQLDTFLASLTSQCKMK